MQRLIRAAIGTNNIDNCSRVCHSPTSFAMRKSFGLSGATGSFTDIDHADVAVLIGVNPTAGPPGRRRADQAGGAAAAASWSRSTRGGSSSPTTACCTWRRGRAPTPRSCSASATSSAATASPTQTFIAARTEGYDALEELLDALHARGRRGDHRHPGRRSSSSAAHLYGEAGTGCLLVGPGRDRAQVRLRGRAAALQPGDDDRQGRQAAARRCCRCAARTTSRARPTWARCPTPTPPTARSTTRRPRELVRGGLGRRAAARGGLHDPADVRRGGRRRAEGDVHLRRGRRPDRSRHRARRRTRSRASSSWSARRSSRTRRPSTPTWCCRPRRSSRRRARSSTPSAASSSSSRRSTRPAARGPTSRSSRTVRRALGHEMGWTTPLGRAGRGRPR